APPPPQPTSAPRSIRHRRRRRHARPTGGRMRARLRHNQVAHLDWSRKKQRVGGSCSWFVFEADYFGGRMAAIMVTPSPARDCPPSQTTTAPVMNFAASLERKSA